MKNVFLRTIACAVAVAATATTCPQGRAQVTLPLQPTELSPSPYNTHGASDVLLVTFQGTTPTFQITLPETPAEGSTVIVPRLGGTPIPGNLAKVGSPLIWLEDPSGLLSDVVGDIQNPFDLTNPNDVVLAFWSDSDNNPLYYPNIPSAFLNVTPNIQIEPDFPDALDNIMLLTYEKTA